MLKILEYVCLRKLKMALIYYNLVYFNKTIKRRKIVLFTILALLEILGIN